MVSYYHAVMFDFDGTLVDTMHEYARIASLEVSKLYDIPVGTARQLYLETSGIPFFQQLNLIFGVDQRNPECAKRFERKKTIFLESIQLKEKTKDILYSIRSLGLSLAITSNNYQELLDAFIEKEPDLFEIVLGFGNGYSKGSTQFTRVIDTFGVDRRYILFVGDSLSDVRKSLAFGIDFVAVSGTLPFESFRSLFPSVPVISDLYELLELLRDNKPINNKEG